MRALVLAMSKNNNNTAFWAARLPSSRRARRSRRARPSRSRHEDHPLTPADHGERLSQQAGGARTVGRDRDHLRPRHRQRCHRHSRAATGRPCAAARRRRFAAIAVTTVAHCLHSLLDISELLRRPHHRRLRAPSVCSAPSSDAVQYLLGARMWPPTAGAEEWRRAPRAARRAAPLRTRHSSRSRSPRK